MLLRAAGGPRMGWMEVVGISRSMSGGSRAGGRGWRCAARTRFQSPSSRTLCGSRRGRGGGRAAWSYFNVGVPVWPRVLGTVIAASPPPLSTPPSCPTSLSLSLMDEILHVCNLFVLVFCIILFFVYFIYT